MLGVVRDATDMEEVLVLVLTAVTLSRELERCMSGGADAVVTKPFDPRDVADAVDALLSAGPRSAQRSIRRRAGREYATSAWGSLTPRRKVFRSEIFPRSLAICDASIRQRRPRRRGSRAGRKTDRGGSRCGHGHTYTCARFGTWATFA